MERADEEAGMRLERGAPAGVRPGAAMLLATAMMTLALALALPSPAQAGVPGERLIAIPSPGPGPNQLDRVWVNKIGPADPDRVLVLMPGTAGGAGDFHAGRQGHRREGPRARGLGDRQAQPAARGSQQVRGAGGG
jgi:hypothetical protein